jgi:N-acetylmuramoyl-L-alanine amidase
MLSKRFVELFIFLALLLPALLLIAGAGAETLPLSGKKICLDPGHGGSDPGAINTLYNLEESDINLEVSYGLRYLLEGAGANVVMARTGDQTLTNSDRYTFCNQEQADILISVHTNSHTDTSWDGSMTLYGPRESPELAQTIHDQMYPFLRDTRPPQIPVDDFIDYGLDHFASGVLFKSDMPAAMVEPLLMSNTYEGPLLVDQIFANFDPANFDYAAAAFNQESCAAFSCRRGQIATAVFQGAMAYFDNQAGGEMHVQAIEMSYLKRGRTYAIDTAVTIVDAQGDPLPAAEVTLQVTLPGGAAELQTALTGADGVAALRTKTSAAGLYEAAVLAVTKDSWTYVPAQNVESTETLIIP